MQRFIVVLMLLPASMLQAEDYAAKRQAMIAAIEKDIRETSSYIDREHFDERVMQVLRELPRHQFVAANKRDQAYDNKPLPIGFGQTISQPYIVALMTELLKGISIN